MFRCKKTHFILFLIILAGVVLRLWHFENLFYFAIDEEKGLYIIRGIATGEHFPTVGHPSSIGFRLGPLLYYLMTPFYLLLGPSPVSWGYVSIVVSIFSMVLIYLLGRQLGKHAGIFSLILYSFSYLNVLYDRRGWQVSFHSFIALLILYSLVQIKKGGHIYVYTLTIALIFATHFEVATILFVPLVLIIWKVFNLKVPQRSILFCIALFFLSHIGLLIFDLRHDFLNSRYLLNYFRPQADIRIAKNVPLTGIREVYLAHNLIPSTLARTLYDTTVPDMAIQYANCPQYLDYKQTNTLAFIKFASIAAILYFAYQTFTSKLKTTNASLISKTIGIYLTIIFTGISIYTYFFHGEMAEYYLLSVFAYFFIILGYILHQLYISRFRMFSILLLFLFMLFNSQKLFATFNPYGLEHKLQAVKYSLSEIGGKDFTLDSSQTCWYSGGYRYLYTFLGHEPSSSYMDQYLYEYYNPQGESKPEHKITLLTPELVGDNPEQYEESRINLLKESNSYDIFGAIEVYSSKVNQSTGSASPINH